MKFICVIIYRLREYYESVGKLRDFRVFMTILGVGMCYLGTLVFFSLLNHNYVIRYLFYLEEQTFFVRNFILNPLMAIPYLIIVVLMVLYFRKTMRKLSLELELNPSKFDRYKNIHKYFVAGGPISFVFFGLLYMIINRF